MALHRSHAAAGRRGSIYSAMRKYADYTPSILVVASDIEFLRALEKRAIAAFNTKVPCGYNLTDGGEGTVGRIFTYDQRAAASKRMKGKRIVKNVFGVGSRHSAESRKKISQAGKGRVFSEETKQKISKTKIGNKYCLGRIVGDETRKKISEAQSGKPRLYARGPRPNMKGRPWSQARREAHERAKN